MKLYVTIGQSDGNAQEWACELQDGIYATFIGLEVDDIRTPEEGGSRTGRQTIMRQPFSLHAPENRIHTICSRTDDEIREIEW